MMPVDLSIQTRRALLDLISIAGLQQSFMSIVLWHYSLQNLRSSRLIVKQIATMKQRV